MDLPSPFNTRGFQNISYGQGCTSSLATFHQLNGLDHQLKCPAHFGQVSHLGHPGFHVLSGWRGRIGRSCSVKDAWGILVLHGIVGRQYVWRDTCLLIFLLAATFVPGFSAPPLSLGCAVDSRITPLGLFLPSVFLGKSVHIFSHAYQLTSRDSQSPSTWPYCWATSSRSNAFPRKPYRNRRHVLVWQHHGAALCQPIPNAVLKTAMCSTL